MANTIITMSHLYTKEDLSNAIEYYNNNRESMDSMYPTLSDVVERIEKRNSENTSEEETKENTGTSEEKPKENTEISEEKIEEIRSISEDAESSYSEEEDSPDVQQSNTDSGIDNAEEAYNILHDGTSNSGKIYKSIEYYFEHMKEMDEAYPNLRTVMLGNEDTRKQIGRFCDRKNERLTAEQNEELTEEQSNFLKSYTSKDIDENAHAYINKESEKQAKEAMNYLKSLNIENVTAAENFRLPDMGDYYLGDVDSGFLKLIDEKMRGKQDEMKACHYSSKAPADSLGYDKKKDLYFLKCTVSYDESDINFGLVDGSHIVLNFNHMSSAEGDTTNAMETLKKKLTANNNTFNLLDGHDEAWGLFDMQIMGISAPTMSRWCRDTIEKDKIRLKTIDVKNFDVKKEGHMAIFDSNYSVEGSGDSSQKQFAFICDAWREIRNVSESNGYISFDWLLSDGDYGIEGDSNGEHEGYNLHETGMKAARMLLEKIHEAGDVIYINVDGEGLSENSNRFPLGSAGTWDSLTSQSDLTNLANGKEDLSMTGYNIVSMGMSRRFLGEVYVRTSNDLSDEVYINLAKLIANDESVMNKGVTYSTDYEGRHRTNFDTTGYDINARAYADAFFETLDELDDRKEIQKELLGVDWENLQDYNVILGDTCFFVPPTNIRMQVYTQSERMELLRAKGSMAKTDPKQKRILAIDLYFNENRGINGTTYVEDLPDGKNKITYSMNSLRSVMSMFRFTPYLPITNRFINKTLNIDAVTLQGLNIQSVPGYPKLIQATLTMAEFKWGVFMPDIKQLSLQDSYSSLTFKEQLENDNTIAYWNRSEEEKEAEREAKKKAKEELKAQHIQNILNGIEDDYDESLEELNEVEELTINKDIYKNWYAMSFNWKTFRYYYQRPIIRGNLLGISGMDFNSDEYIASTCGSLTSFVPMEFMDPGIKFYMANEDYLKEILRERYELLKGVTQVDFNDAMIAFMRACGEINDALQELQGNEDFIAALQDLNDFTTKNGIEFSDLSDMWNTTGKTAGVVAGGAATGLAAGYAAGATAGAAVGMLGGPVGVGVGVIGGAAIGAIGGAIGGGVGAYNTLGDDIRGNYNLGCITNGMGIEDEALEKVNNILAMMDKAIEPVRMKHQTYFMPQMKYISHMDGNEDNGSVNGLAMFCVSLEIKQGALSDTDMEAFRKNLEQYMKTDVFHEGAVDYDIKQTIGIGDTTEEMALTIPLGIDIEGKVSTYGMDINDGESEIENGMAYNEFYTGQKEDSADSDSTHPSRLKNTDWKDRSNTFFVPMENSTWRIMGDTGAMKFLATANELADKYEKMHKEGGYAETVPDVEALMNLKYDEWELGETAPIVISWSASMTNRFANLRALGADDDSPQYLGGSDVSIEVEIQTQDEKTAKRLIAIPSEITRLTRTYHAVMPCVPLRIESEFSKYIGVNEVTCEDAIITTNEEYPGLYTIKMNFVSMDRTVRQREAAVRKPINNSGYNKTPSEMNLANYSSKYNSNTFGHIINGISSSETAFTGAILGGLAFAALVFFTGGTALGVLGGLYAAGHSVIALSGAAALGGAIGGVASGGFVEILKEAWSAHIGVDEDAAFGDGTEISKKHMQYFELKKALAENDLYPDLELPTLEEMKKLGYQFLRYNFDDERVYVDPDFYFIYPMAIQSHIYREMAIHGFDEGFCDIKMTDGTGACATVHATDMLGYTVGETNEIYERQAGESRARRIRIQRALNEQKQDKKENKKKETSEPRVSMTAVSVMAMEKESWKICDKINTMFLEKRYKSELETYLSKQGASSVGNTDVNRGTSDAESVEQAQKESEENKDNQEKVQTESTTKAVNQTEGEFAMGKIKPAKEAAAAMLEYLKETSVDQMIGSSYTAPNFSIMSSSTISSNISSAVSQFIELNEVSRFLKALQIDITSDFKTMCGKIVYAAACSGTGDKEYSGKDCEDWKPRNAHLGNVYTAGYGDIKAKFISDYEYKKQLAEDKKKMDETIDYVVNRGRDIGVFGISMFSLPELNKILQYIGSEEEFESNYITCSKEWAEEKAKSHDPEKDPINMVFYFVDPYYRKEGIDVTEIEKYKRGCICDVKYSTFAFMRLMMYWLFRLVQMHALPTIFTDMFRDTSRAEVQIDSTVKDMTKVTPTMIKGKNGDLISVTKYIDFFSKGTAQLDNGKMYTAALLAETNGESLLLSSIDERNYSALNAIIQSCATTTSTFDALNNPGPYAIKKMTLALVGQKVIDSMSALGVSQTSPGLSYSRDKLQKLYLEAANNPRQYIPHSYHDMVVNDARGRMLRAFPTFYMCFIDEGREVGFWKLHDNFYNTSSIMSIEVVKSRKLPADTCTIVMSNFYNSYTTETEDYVKTQVATIDQAWNSLFSPSDYFKEMETIRQNKPPEVRLRLRAGARIHVRMGYGNNAAMIPVAFNGVITEVDVTNAVQIVAQGDGWELLNPIDIDKQVHNMSHSEEWLDSVDNADTPLQIVTALFNCKGGIIKEKLRDAGVNLFPRNPFGIVHFGDPDFRTLVTCGEACQNLYEVSNQPIFGGNIRVNGDSGEAREYDRWSANKGTPQITFDMFQKTPWDILNICKSLGTDFRLAVMPFGFRSTVFMGSPHYYMCYDYFKDVDGVVKEKRKPFQQWHIYTDVNDIIGNGIVATARDMHNVAIGMFNRCTIFNIETQQTVGPLYADWDIYPESQRSMIVDTNLLGKGPAGVGVFTNWITNIGEDAFNLWDDEGAVVNHRKVAWRSTASALREGVMEMYAGDLVLFGDPSVKPQDRFYISDSYSGIAGQALVKEVVHRLSFDTGFTTTISPDCVACVEDNHEIICTTNMEGTGSVTSMFAELTNSIIPPNDNSLKYMAGNAAMGAVGLGAGIYATHAAKAAFEAKTKGASVKTADDLLKAVGAKASKYSFKRFGAKLAMGLLKGFPLIRVATTVASVFVFPFINAFLEEELKNYKVIKIYPLKKFGYAYTAGFEGARGTVYGSPTWGDRGSLGDIFDLIEDKCPILGTVSDFIFNDEVKSLAYKYQRDNSIINGDQTAADMELKYGQFSAHMAGDEFTYQATGYREQQLSPRATIDKPASIQAAISRLAINDIENYHNDPKMKHMRLISQDSRLMDYVNEQFLLIVHEDPGMETGRQALEDVLIINGKQYRTKYYKSVDDDGNEVIDIPLLNRDAMNILYEIVRRAKNYMPNANSMDPNEHYESLKNSFLSVKSALRIGDKTSMGCTGSTFIISGSDETSYRALKSAITTLDSEIKNDNNKKLGYNTNLFSYDEIVEDREVRVFVNPPLFEDENTKTRYQSKNNKDNETEEESEGSSTDEDTPVTNEKASSSDNKENEKDNGTEKKDSNTEKKNEADSGSSAGTTGESSSGAKKAGEFTGEEYLSASANSNSNVKAEGNGSYSITVNVSNSETEAQVQRAAQTVATSTIANFKDKDNYTYEITSVDVANKKATIRIKKK